LLFPASLETILSMKITLRFLSLVLLLAFCVGMASAQKMNVKIVKRQNSETNYNYTVLGDSSSTSTGKVNCSGDASNVNCSGSTTINGETTAPREVSYSVTGATFSLLLPDGRIAIVNCESKRKGSYNERRSCRTPLVDEIKVDFKGKNAKLEWPVSLDGKKFESETYTILAVLQK
jgi:hypothetical protein